ncbi:NAD(P)-binding protein [Polychaeton citri CBS 116435]|uniref:NAD(P)-binding protein n=1 Tax=Polychaeton citri CBS 116435 TaxID=1314669 RepID=A0A9P4Q1N6_9PEZI|nr:NAD(P)-binding protein [Polychaeton citri CBS 116435]
MSRTVLITGGNSGIGYAISNLLSSLGAYHVLLASRSQAKGEAAVNAIKSGNSKANISAIVLDVDDAGSIDAAAKQVSSTYGGKLDALINNAGIYDPSLPIEEDFARSFKTNVTGSVLVTEAFKPLLLKVEKSYLLFTSSTLGSIGIASENVAAEAKPICAAYRASKAAMNMVAVEYAKELGAKGVRVFPYCPGLVESNLRGTAPQAVTAGGNALSADTSAALVRDVLDGKWDGHAGKFINKNGVQAW